MQSIRNQLLHLHENAEGVLYEQITESEKTDYVRVKEMVGQMLVHIEMLHKPSVVKEGQMQEYYQNYLKFYEHTLNQAQLFEKKAESFALKPFVEALD